MSILQAVHRPNEFLLVDNENTLTDSSTVQKQLKQNANTNGSTESIICVENTTTHHNYYDGEKLGDDTVKNSSNRYPGSQSIGRPLGMGNPGIIGTWGFATITMLMALHKLILPTNSNHLMLPTALVFGGLAQFLSGFLVLISGDSFGGTLYVCFGSYWLGSGLMMVPAIGESLSVYTNNNELATTTAIFLFLWAFFSLMVCAVSLRIKNGSFLLTCTLFLIFLNLFLEACYSLTNMVPLMRASGVACVCASLCGYYTGIVDLFAEQGTKMWTGRYYSR